MQGHSVGIIVFFLVVQGYGLQIFVLITGSEGSWCTDNKTLIIDGAGSWCRNNFNYYW